MKKIQELPNGHINKTYKVEKDGCFYVRKVLNYNGYNHRIDYQILDNFDFCPKLLKKNEIEIEWEFIDGTIPITNSKNLKIVAKILKKVHNSKYIFPSNNIWERIIDNIQQAKKNNPSTLPIEIDNYFEQAKKMFLILDQDSPIHCDVWWNNFLITTNNKMYLIDWEFAVMGDHHWDVAYFIESAYLNKKEEELFLKEYGTNKISSNKLNIAKFIVNYTTITWLFTLPNDNRPFPYEPLLKNMNNVLKLIKF